MVYVLVKVLLGRILGGVIAVALLAWGGPARAGSAAALELLREARAHVAAHEDDVAVRRYTEALALDATLPDAYLGLGELRARQGDAREAERVYSVALAHVPSLRSALAGRARARWAMGQHDDAELDMFAFATEDEDPAALRELAGWYGEDGRVPAQLAIWRRLLAAATRKDDKALARDARTMVRALQILVGPADPAMESTDRGEPRRSIAAIARRGG